MKRILPILILLVLLPGWAFATDYYIDPDCDNNGDGTVSTCASSEGAEGAFNSWDNISVSAGNGYYQKRGSTFNGVVVISGVVATEGNEVIIGAFGNGDQKAKIKWATGAVTDTFQLTDSEYFIIQDIDFDGNSSGANDNICLFGSSNNIIQRCVSHDSSGSGYWFSSGTGASLNNKLIESVGYSLESGVYSFTTSTGLIIENCTFSNNSLYGIKSMTDSTGVEIRNTISWNTGVIGYDVLVLDVTNADGGNNLVGTYHENWPAGLKTNDISSDPLFVNATAGNFTLKPNSPPSTPGHLSGLSPPIRATS